MDFPVIEGPPDEIVQLKYIEEVRPRETGKRRERITAPHRDPGPTPYFESLMDISSTSKINVAFGGIRPSMPISS